MQTTCGIDLVEVERFRQLKPEILKRFYERVFTQHERDYIGSSYERAAGLFAAKEAIVKALGCGIGPVSWQEVEITHTAENQPQVHLSSNAAARADRMAIRQWSLSISHTKDHATAMTVALMEKKGGQ
jgi:holo-[acyl-carrier protein] synthase